MTRRKDIDPTSSAAALFAHKLRRHRDARGWSQDQLGARAFCSDDLISKIETMKQVATLDMAKLFDQIFGLDGYFEELQPLAAQELHPEFFRSYTQLERTALSVKVYDRQFIVGLAQIEEYARTVLGAAHSGEELEKLVTARLARQEILDRDEPPWLVILLHENALREPVGSADVMRKQLEHLLELMRRHRISLQIIPVGAPVYPSTGFTLFGPEDEPDLAWVDGAGGNGRAIKARDKVEELKVLFDQVHAVALTTADSECLIREILEST